MATHPLDYGIRPGFKFRKLPWRRIIGALIVVYFAAYVGVRLTGGITYSWASPVGKVSGTAYDNHSFDCRSRVVFGFFTPAAVVEMAIRDLCR